MQSSPAAAGGVFAEQMNCATTNRGFVNEKRLFTNGITKRRGCNPRQRRREVYLLNK